MSGTCVLVLYAHPDPANSRVNRRLRDAIRDLDSVVLHDLYELYPDLAMDVQRERHLLDAAHTLVMMHPLYWYSAPAIIKEWEDVVLARGYAYGPGSGALQGKRWWQVVTTGGRPDAYSPQGYNRFTLDELLRPFEATAHMCGMQWLPPTALHHARHVSDEALERHVGAVVEQLRQRAVEGAHG